MTKKISKGKLITELVKGSLEYTRDWINQQFRRQFPYNDMGPNFYIVDSFADHVVVESYSSPELMPSEFYMVPFTKSGDVYTFAARDVWEIVELTYQPQTRAVDVAVSEGKKKIKKGQRFKELIEARIVLKEREEGKPRQLKVEKAITADIVNGNKRRYPAQVVSAAIAELGGHLHETAREGRAIQVLGEAEHPSDKNGRANLLETIVRWDEITFNGQDVDVTGTIIETDKGKNLLALMENGVMPGVSLRGYGEGKSIGKGEDKVFEVTELHITGFDLVLEPSFENAAELIESQNQSSEDEMNLLEELMKLRTEHPELFPGVTEAQLNKMGEDQLKALDETLRKALGIDANANIMEAVKGNADKAKLYDAMTAKKAVEDAITEATKDLKFGKELNEAFIESIKEAELATPEAVKKFAESKTREYGKLASKKLLVGMGFDEKKRTIQVLGDVLENETGTPEFARASFEITESIRKNQNRSKRMSEMRAESPAQIFTLALLERFDALHQRELMAESRMLEEATETGDLNIPYSVSRAMIEEAFPDLVSANIFDVGVIATSPTRLYFEATSGESGYAVTITDEVEAGGAEGAWYNLSHGRISPAGVAVTSNPAGTTYVEGTDFVIDYAGGRIKFLAAGDIGTNDVLVDYTYTAIRDGEMAPIERVSTSLTYQTIEAAADRLADQISSEAIVFSRSQLGWDVVGRTMTNLIKQMRRKIDQGLLYAAFSAVKAVASNSTDTWTVGATQDDLADLVALMGNANVIVANRFYEPTFYLMSVTNADRLSNWEGFMRTGFPNVFLNAAGFAGVVKGKPIFASTEFPDTLIIAGNRELVAHRVLQPLMIKGPFPTYATTGDVTRLVAADQYYAEEYNFSGSFVNEKGAFVPINDAGS
jgi:hypothetical protein